MAYKITDKCISCGACVESCPFGAIATKTYMVDVIEEIKAGKRVVAMVAPAIEYKKEGPVLGTGAKLFSVAGPVLVCGISAATVVGIIYWFIEKI